MTGLIAINFLITALAIASISALWRRILFDKPALFDFVTKKLFYPLNIVLSCGISFVYWTTFIVLLVVDPLAGWLPPLRIALPIETLPIITFLFSWMALGMAAALFRFSFVALHEAVLHRLRDQNTTASSSSCQPECR